MRETGPGGAKGRHNGKRSRWCPSTPARHTPWTCKPSPPPSRPSCRPAASPSTWPSCWASWTTSAARSRTTPTPTDGQPRSSSGSASRRSSVRRLRKTGSRSFTPNLRRIWEAAQAARNEADEAQVAAVAANNAADDANADLDTFVFRLGPPLRRPVAFPTTKRPSDAESPTPAGFLLCRRAFACTLLLSGGVSLV
jgi:hypothetical protein